jgi:hypothetical protein
MLHFHLVGADDDTATSRRRMGDFAMPNNMTPDRGDS